MNLEAKLDKLQILKTELEECNAFFKRIENANNISHIQIAKERTCSQMFILDSETNSEELTAFLKGISNQFEAFFKKRKSEIEQELSKAISFENED